MRDQEHGCRADADPARGQRTAAGALDSAVELAIEDVIIGRARAAHGDRADQEERQVSDNRPLCSASPASAAPCQHGASSNCQPIGRSSRAS